MIEAVLRKGEDFKWRFCRILGVAAFTYSVEVILLLAIEYARKAAQYAEANSEHGAQQAQAYAATAQAYAAIAQSAAQHDPAMDASRR